MPTQGGAMHRQARTTGDSGSSGWEPPLARSGAPASSVFGPERSKPRRAKSARSPSSGISSRFPPAGSRFRKTTSSGSPSQHADVAHSFTIDVPYRISKRAGTGQSVVFEFRADEPGRFTFYCNLTQDDRCKQMKGELVVR